MPHWANLKQHRGYQTVKGEIVLAHHKTAREGPAGITMAKDDLQLVCNYIHKTHLSQMNHSTHNVFVGLQGNPIKQQNKNFQWLGVRYKVENHCYTWQPTVCNRLWCLGQTRVSPRTASLIRRKCCANFFGQRSKVLLPTLLRKGHLNQSLPESTDEYHWWRPPQCSQNAFIQKKTSSCWIFKASVKQNQVKNESPFQ